MVTDYVAITWNDKAKGWMLQMCHRMGRGYWTYDAPLAGPFRTKKMAQVAKKILSTAR
jgi:hypothetical protein